MQPNTKTYTSFNGHQRIASGALVDNVLAVKRALRAKWHGQLLIFDDETGRTVDVDTRGTKTSIAARLMVTASREEKPSTDPGEVVASSPRGRGRPKLGVVPREVTLLPRHWEWLATRPGGASVALRKLIDDARRANSEKDEKRCAQERAYHFMQAIAGDLPGFEEATRALFADDASRTYAHLRLWPEDIRAHAMTLAFGVAWRSRVT